MNDRTDDSTPPTQLSELPSKAASRAHKAPPRLREGQVVRHARFRYRGVVALVDDGARRSTPWYHVLVHGTGHTAFVPETLLEADETPTPIDHPNVGVYFDEFKGGKYLRTRVLN
ncbi:MAG: DNA-binding protein [Deltaproteobacteria bacterium]|nr:DNA-binding protein [Deltaproteobacteria bacterium]